MSMTESDFSTEFSQFEMIEWRQNLDEISILDPNFYPDENMTSKPRYYLNDTRTLNELYGSPALPWDRELETILEIQTRSDFLTVNPHAGFQARILHPDISPVRPRLTLDIIRSIPSPEEISNQIGSAPSSRFMYPLQQVTSFQPSGSFQPPPSFQPSFSFQPPPSFQPATSFQPPTYAPPEPIPPMVPSYDLPQSPTIAYQPKVIGVGAPTSPMLQVGGLMVEGDTSLIVTPLRPIYPRPFDPPTPIVEPPVMIPPTGALITLPRETRLLSKIGVPVRRPVRIQAIPGVDPVLTKGTVEYRLNILKDIKPELLVKERVGHHKAGYSREDLLIFVERLGITPNGRNKPNLIDAILQLRKELDLDR